jgi:hypothetical protein
MPFFSKTKHSSLPTIPYDDVYNLSSVVSSDKYIKQSKPTLFQDDLTVLNEYLKTQKGLLSIPQKNPETPILTLDTNYKLTQMYTRAPISLLTDVPYMDFLEWLTLSEGRCRLSEYFYTHPSTNTKILLVVGHNNKMQELAKHILQLSQNNKTEITSCVPSQHDYEIDMYRHSYSCNNLKDKYSKKYGFMGTIYGASQKDWEPSLTIQGIIGAYDLGKQLNYETSTVLNVCVSCLIRTWETAILLFLHNTPSLNLIICPFLKEEEAMGFKRGNYPMPLYEQIKKINLFFEIIKNFINQGFIVRDFLSEKKVIIKFQYTEVKVIFQFDSDMNSTVTYYDENGTSKHVSFFLLASDGEEESSATDKDVGMIKVLSKTNQSQLKNSSPSIARGNKTLSLLKNTLKEVSNENCWGLQISVCRNNIKQISIFNGFTPVKGITLSSCELSCDYFKRREDKVNNSKENKKCMYGLKKKLSIKNSKSKSTSNRHTVVASGKKRRSNKSKKRL